MKQEQKQTKKFNHDPARTLANKARRAAKAEKARLLHKAMKVDHGALRWQRRAKLAFLPPKAVKAVKALQHAATEQSRPIPLSAMYQLGMRAVLRETRS